MLVLTLAVLALSAPAPDPVPRVEPAALVVAADHGKLPWFQGTFEELLAAAKKENKPVFVDFWADWCVWCKRLEKDTFTDDSVVEGIQGFLVAHVDVESETGKPVAQRFGIGPLPTLMFLEPDGSVRDVLLGYLKPAEFKREVTRIRLNIGTITDLRRQVAAAPKDVGKQIELARKLKAANDLKGYEAQVAAVIALDPERKDPKVAELAFEALMTRVEALWQRGEMDGIPALVQAHLAQETSSELLFRGYVTLANIHEELGRMAAQKRQSEAAEKHALDAVAAKKEAWKHVPDASVLPFGRQLGQELWEMRASLGEADRTLALDIARKLQGKAETSKSADALDVVACLYSMNGKKDEAIAVLRKAIQFDPSHSGVSAHLKEFGG